MSFMCFEYSMMMSNPNPNPNSKFEQLPNGYDDFIHRSQPIKTFELFSINNNKVYTFCDLSISWRKSKSLLCFDGTKSSDIKRKLCKGSCKIKKNNLEPTEACTSTATGHSSKLHV